MSVSSGETRRIEVAAIYDTHFGDYDKLYIFAPLSFTQSICGTDSLSGNRFCLRYSYFVAVLGSVAFRQ